MLKNIYEYELELQDEYRKSILDPYFNFWAGSYWSEKLSIPDSTYSDLMFVSVGKNNKVFGYFKASIDRSANNVTRLGIMNFTKNKMNMTFNRDFANFLDSLFSVYNLNKIVFTVVVGNPVEKMYDRYIKKYNGRIIGISKKDVFINGKLYDNKYYEIFKEDYLEVKNGAK